MELESYTLRGDKASARYWTAKNVVPPIHCIGIPTDKAVVHVHVHRAHDLQDV